VNHGLRFAGGIGPAKGGANRAFAIPKKRLGDGFDGIRDAGLEKFWGCGCGFLGKNDIAGRLHIHQPPSELIIGAGAA